MNIQNPQVEKMAEQEWSANENVRAEFGDNKRAYIAYRLAQASGKVKILASGSGLRVEKRNS